MPAIAPAASVSAARPSLPRPLGLRTGLTAGVPFSTSGTTAVNHPAFSRPARHLDSTKPHALPSYRRKIWDGLTNIAAHRENRVNSRCHPREIEVLTLLGCATGGFNRPRCCRTGGGGVACPPA